MTSSRFFEKRLTVHSKSQQSLRRFTKQSFVVSFIQRNRAFLFFLILENDDLEKRFYYDEVRVSLDIKSRNCFSDSLETLRNKITIFDFTFHIAISDILRLRVVVEQIEIETIVAFNDLAHRICQLEILSSSVSMSRFVRRFVVFAVFASRNFLKRKTRRHSVVNENKKSEFLRSNSTSSLRNKRTRRTSSFDSRERMRSSRRVTSRI